MIDTQTPVTGDDFFNRSEILERLFSTGRNYALIGLRKSGKTSIPEQISSSHLHIPP